MVTTELAGSVLSLNVGRAREIPAPNGRTVLTAIYKSAVEGPLHLGRTGFEGDQQADLRVHGGPNKAVYAYPSEHYPVWKEELGLAELPFGSFGENLTTTGLLESNVVIGDLFQIGTAIVQVAQPRMPCAKLALRFGRADMVKLFWASNRSGIYFSVVQEGAVNPGDALIKREDGPEQVTIADVVRLFKGEDWSGETRERAIRSPLRGSWKEGIRARLTESS